MKISEAEAQIATILAGLELLHNAYVEAVEIEDIEITGFQDERPNLERRVTIELKRRPGCNWGQVSAQPPEGL